MINKPYGVIHSWYPDSEGGGGEEIEWYSTLDEARDEAMSGDTIIKFIERK